MMATSGPRHGATRRRTLVAAIVAILAASAGYAVWVVTHARAVHEREVSAELQRAADAQAAGLDSLVTRWSHLLGTIRALDDVAEPDFERFVDEALSDRDPNGEPIGTFGGMGSVIWVEAEGSAAVVRHGRPDSLLDQVEGLDLAQLPDRRTALEASRDSGRATTTGFFVPATELDLDPSQQSRLASIYVPVYVGGGVPPTVAERRASLRGWAITGFRADTLLDHIATDVRLSTTLVVDGEPVWNDRTGGADLPLEGEVDGATATLANGWSVTVHAATQIRPRGGMAAYPALEGFMVLAAGVGLSLGVWRIGSSREAALRVADHRRREAEAMRTARRHMADHLSIGLIDADADGIVRFVNGPAAELIGVDQSAAVDTRFDELLAELSAADLSVSMGSGPEGDAGARTSLLPTATGRHVRLSWTRDHTGGVLATIEDVTDHLTEIKELNDSLDAAVEAHDQGQRIMATLSHEIRTPLAGIVGLARTLIDEGIADRSVGERIERIERSGADLLRIADDSLTVAVADTSSLTLRPSTVDLRRHLDETIDDVRARSASDAELRVVMSGRTEHVTVDSARLRQIVGNLVENALRHTREGHVEVAFDVAGGTADESVLSITVSDTGDGIPNAKLARIFEPFVQVDDSTTRVGGAGLGLSVVRKLVDAMGGTVTATSVVGLGSRFRVEIPVRIPPVETGPHRSTNGTLDPDPSGRALLVEDDDTSALVTRTALERLGFAVDRIADGATAVETVRDGCPHDIVVLDLHLPGVDGFAVLAALDRRPGQLVVTATASSHPTDLERCRELEVDAVLQKPVASEDLAGLISRDGTADETVPDGARDPDDADGPDGARGSDDARDPVDGEQLQRLVELGIHHELFSLLDTQIHTVRQQLLTGDTDSMCLALHTMAGSMRVLGASSARDRLAAAERHLREGGDVLDVRDEADDLVRRVIGAVERAEAMIGQMG